MYDAIVVGARVAGATTAMLLVDRATFPSDTMSTHYIWASGVARAVDAPRYHEKPSLACYYYSYWSGIPDEGSILYPRDRRVIVRLPTNDGLTCLGVGWTSAEFPVFRLDVEGNFLDTLRLAPELADLAAAGRREERFVGTADLPNVFRKPYGLGWALVGDAGFHKDPILGHGITDAFLDAELLAEALDAGLGGRTQIDQALADYERRRNERATAHYEMSCELATLAPPPPDMQRLFGALRDNQADTDRYIGVLDGSVPVGEFFAPPNLERILAEADPALSAAA